MLRMEFRKAITRYQFLSEALDGTGGFLPTVAYGPSDGLDRPVKVLGPCHVVPHPRESAEKYAARVACAVYENHLRQACERFAAYLSRKSPSRQGADAPLAQQFIQDADDGGSHLDVVMHRLVIDAKARGCMLVLMDLARERTDLSLGDTLMGQRSNIPYIAPIKPETVADCDMDDHGRFTSIGIHSTALVNGKREAVIRRWDAESWQVWKGQELIESGQHPFGQCPVLYITENGGHFPQVGKFAQIADLSKRLYNCSAETDDILRSQTFSVLTLQIPPDVPNPAESIKNATANIGTHSLLVHQGDTPEFIAPDSGPAQVYLARIAALQSAIDRIGMETASQPGQQQESGIARKMRFEQLNADLASFARLLQDLEMQIWALFHRALGQQNPVQVEWPTDYNLTDTAAELDILALMQATGFPDAVQREKRRAVVLAEFDRSTQETMAELMAAIDEQAQETVPATE